MAVAEADDRALGAIAIGCMATAGFYFLQPLMGYSAMFLLFVLMWVGLGVLTGRVLQRRDDLKAILVRSALAAVGSGLGFYVISGIWDAVQSSRPGLRETFPLLDARLSPRVRGAARSTPRLKLVSW
jgi:hypothetical protein